MKTAGDKQSPPSGPALTLRGSRPHALGGKSRRSCESLKLQQDTKTTIQPTDCSSLLSHFLKGLVRVASLVTLAQGEVSSSFFVLSNEHQASVLLKLSGFSQKKRLKGKKHNSGIFTSATLGGFVQLMILNWTYFSGHNVHTNLQNLLFEIKHTIRPIFFFANLNRSHLPNRLNYHISLYTVVYGIKFSYDCLVSSARTHLLVWWFYRIPEI